MADGLEVVGQLRGEGEAVRHVVVFATFQAAPDGFGHLRRDVGKDVRLVELRDRAVDDARPSGGVDPEVGGTSAGRHTGQNARRGAIVVDVENAEPEYASVVVFQHVLEVPRLVLLDADEIEAAHSETERHLVVDVLVRLVLADVRRDLRRVDAVKCLEPCREHPAGWAVRDRNRRRLLRDALGVREGEWGDDRQGGRNASEPFHGTLDLLWDAEASR